MVTGAEISQSRRTNDAVSMFSYKYLSETAKSHCAVKRIPPIVKKNTTARVRES